MIAVSRSLIHLHTHSLIHLHMHEPTRGGRQGTHVVDGKTSLIIYAAPELEGSVDAECQGACRGVIHFVVVCGSVFAAWSGRSYVGLARENIYRLTKLARPDLRGD